MCSECVGEKTVRVIDNSVDEPQKIKIMIFSLLALATLSNLFINILDYEVLYKDMGFSFFSVISEISEFKCLEGTTGTILLSMLVLLITGIKLASKVGYALCNCAKKDKMKKIYSGLISGCAFWGLSCLVTSLIIYFSHKSAIKKIGVGSLVSNPEISTLLLYYMWLRYYWR